MAPQPDVSPVAASAARFDTRPVLQALLTSWRTIVARVDIRRRDWGQTMAEYALIVVVIAIVVIVAAKLFGGNVSSQMSTSAGHV